MDNLNYILKKYNLTPGTDPRIQIPNINRVTLTGWFHDLNFKIGVEVGVAAGEYSLEIYTNNPQLEKLYGVDPYIPLFGYKDYKRERTFSKLLSDAEGRLDKLPKYQFIRDTSMQAVKEFKDSSIDFVYIDANHSDPWVTQDITEWTKKVRVGGIVSGHDYTSPQSRSFPVNYNVKEAVGKYTKEHNINPWFVLGSFNKVKGEVRDSARSWAFVKL